MMYNEFVSIQRVGGGLVIRRHRGAIPPFHSIGLIKNNGGIVSRTIPYNPFGIFGGKNCFSISVLLEMKCRTHWVKLTPCRLILGMI